MLLSIIERLCSVHHTERPRLSEGQGLVEYALILVLVAIVVIIILSVLGGTISNGLYGNILAHL